MMWAIGSQLMPALYSLFQIRQGTVVRVCHTFFNHGSAGSFILDETARTDAILACAGEFEGLNLARFHVAVNAPVTDSRKSCGVMNAYKFGCELYRGDTKFARRETVKKTSIV